MTDIRLSEDAIEALLDGRRVRVTDLDLGPRDRNGKVTLVPPGSDEWRETPEPWDVRIEGER